jgi:hypothetical protein
MNQDICHTIKTNLERILFGLDGDIFSLKLDGIAIKDSVRWCSYNNEFTGTCYGCRENMSTYSFNYSSNLEELKQALDDDLIHKCNELLVISVTKKKSLWF